MGWHSFSHSFKLRGEKEIVSVRTRAQLVLMVSHKESELNACVSWIEYRVCFTVLTRLFLAPTDSFWKHSGARFENVYSTLPFSSVCGERGSPSEVWDVIKSAVSWRYCARIGIPFLDLHSHVGSEYSPFLRSPGPLEEVEAILHAVELARRDIVSSAVHRGATGRRAFAELVLVEEVLPVRQREIVDMVSLSLMKYARVLPQP